MRFIALDVSVEFVLIYRPHPVQYLNAWLYSTQIAISTWFGDSDETIQGADDKLGQFLDQGI